MKNEKKYKTSKRNDNEGKIVFLLQQSEIFFPTSSDNFRP